MLGDDLFGNDENWQLLKMMIKSSGFDTSHINVADMSVMDACKCIYTSMTKLRNDAMVQKYKENTICVPMHGELPIQDSYSLPYRNRLIQKGEDACNAFLKKGIVRPRRFSAV